MTTIKVQFQSNGETVKRTAIISDDKRELSSSQRNQAYDICQETYGDGYWSIFFEGEPGTQYEIEFKFDSDNRLFTLEPIKAITWEDDIITDVQKAIVTIR